MRSAKFAEGPRWVKMEMTIPELLDSRDRHTMEALSSGFATHLVFDLGLFEWGARVPMSTVHLEIRIHYDIFNRSYVVRRSENGGAGTVRTFKLREDAIAHAVNLKLKIAGVDALTRGRGSVYHVRVFAQRNPIEGRPRKNEVLRGEDRDFSMFTHWVNMFVRSAPKAEFSVELRSSAFYLVEG